MRYPDSDHCHNGRFFNPGVAAHTLKDMLRWRRTSTPGAWRRTIPATPGAAPAARVSGGELAVTFVGHSTVLLQTEGLNILTDPIWSERCSPVSWAGPRRHRIPGIRLEELPKIDLILLSHNHYDHCDLPTLRHLVQRDAPTIACPLGLARLLRRLGFDQIMELDWEQTASFAAAELRCVRAQHFAARGPFDRDRTLWCGWAVTLPSGTLYFAGDSGFGSFFQEIARKLGPIRLALLPIGAYEPEWFMGSVHMSPAQAVAVHRILQPQESIAIHYGTFSLADDGELAPAEALREELQRNPPPTPFRMIPEGECYRIAAPQTVRAGEPALS